MVNTKIKKDYEYNQINNKIFKIKLFLNKNFII